MTEKEEDVPLPNQAQRRLLLQSILRYGRKKGIIAPQPPPVNKQSLLCAISEDKNKVLSDVVSFWSKITKDAKEQAQKVNEAESSVKADWQSKWGLLLELLQKKVDDIDQRKGERLASSEAGLWVSQHKLELPLKREEKDIRLEKSVKKIEMGIDDISNFYAKYKLEEYREGVLLVAMDEKGEVVDYNHHIVPKLHLPATVKVHNKDEKPQLEHDPKLFDDEVFESWFKTNQMFFRMIQNNKDLWPLALQSIHVDQWETYASKKNWKCPPDHQHILFELRIQLLDEGEPGRQQQPLTEEKEEEQKQPEPIAPSPSSSERKSNRVFGMCSLLEEWFPIMQYSPLHRSSILDIMNAIHSTNFSSSSPRATLDYYKIRPMIVCPHVFVLMEWSRRQHKLSQVAFNKHVSYFMDLSLPFMMHLYETGSAPVCLGLRGLILTNKEIFLSPSSPSSAAEEQESRKGDEGQRCPLGGLVIPKQKN